MFGVCKMFSIRIIVLETYNHFILFGFAVFLTMCGCCGNKREVSAFILNYSILNEIHKDKAIPPKVLLQKIKLKIFYKANILPLCRLQGEKYFRYNIST